MNQPDPTVFVVDDDPSVLKAVSGLLRVSGFNVITYGSSRKFLEHCNPVLHGCIVLDVAMPEINGLELQAALVEKGAALPIIFLTGKGDIPMSVQAMKLGAVDFLTKPVRRDKLEAAIRMAIEKDRAGRKIRLEVTEIRKRMATLTPREYEVFRHVISGKLNKQTAAELQIAEKTIKVHRARVMEKMQVHSVAELVHLSERALPGEARATL